MSVFQIQWKMAPDPNDPIVKLVVEMAGDQCECDMYEGWPLQGCYPCRARKALREWDSAVAARANS